MKFGKIIILNGAPRSGKSSIVKVVQNTFDGIWLNIGVDVYVDHITPPGLQPGIGLRPGGERPDLESFVEISYKALYQSIAIHSSLGLNVIADVCHHNNYSKPLNILPACAKILADHDVLSVGVKCPIETIMARRNEPDQHPKRNYLKGTVETPVPSQVLLWEQVHYPGIYDLEVDTSLNSPEICGGIIRDRLASETAPDAFKRLAKLSLIA